MKAAPCGKDPSRLITHARLGLGLVFDDEITVSGGCLSDAISEADKGSKAVGNLGKAEVRAEQDKRAERMWEPAKGSMEGKGSGEQEGHGG